MTNDPRLAALLADTKVRKASKAVLAHFETGMSTEGVECALKHFAESLLDRSAPETPNDDVGLLRQRLERYGIPLPAEPHTVFQLALCLDQHLNGLLVKSETPEAMRLEAAKALVVSRGDGLPSDYDAALPEALRDVDAVSPILEAPLRRENEQLKDCMADSMEQEIRLATVLGVRNKALDWDVYLAEVTRLKARLAEVEGAYKALQECRRCDGRGWITHAEGRDECPDCRGTGENAALSLEAPRE